MVLYMISGINNYISYLIDLTNLTQICEKHFQILNSHLGHATKQKVPL
jgi:hypothetical protein